MPLLVQCGLIGFLLTLPTQIKTRNDELCNVFISNRIKIENFSNGIYFKTD